MRTMNDDQLKYIEKILEANLATLREEIRGVRSDLLHNRETADTRWGEIVQKIEDHTTRLNALEALSQSITIRLGIMASIGGMLMAVFYEWIKKNIGQLF